MTGVSIRWCSSKIIICLLLAASVSCLDSSDLSSKLLRTECTVHDSTILQNASCSTKPISRLVTVLNVKGYLTQTVSKALVNIQVFKRSEVKFRPFFINVTEDFCAFMTKQMTGQYLELLTSIYLPYTNMNHTCPYYEGYVEVKDLPLDSRTLPAIWPHGEYRMDILVIGDQKKIVTLQFFAEIKERKPKWIKVD